MKPVKRRDPDRTAVNVRRKLTDWACCIVWLAGIACGSAAVAADSASSTAPPNILFILVDDMGWGDLGVNWQNRREGRRHRTPHLDAMARDGINLTRHYCAAPVCAPSRASLLTGLHQGNAIIRDNQFDYPLEDNHTLATVLRSAGYHTAMIGKYGLQGGKERTDASEENPANWPAYPTKRGFDDFFGYVRHRDGHQHYPGNIWPLGDSPNHREKKQVWHNDREISDTLSGCYTADLFTAFTKKTIIDHVRGDQRDQPFFVMLNFDTPHAALQLPTMAYPKGFGVGDGLQWVGRSGRMINTAADTIDTFRHPDYVNQGWTDIEERFATSMRRIDNCVADLRETLKQLGIADETLIVFTSDNGPLQESYVEGKSHRPVSFASYGPFDGIKRDCWEGGVRMPTLVCWPGRLKPGTDAMASQFHDWLPTLADAAGLVPPARTDGVSLLPRWTGDASAARPSQIYIEYFNNRFTPKFDDFLPRRRGRKRQQMQVIHEGPFKGVRYQIESADDAFEIYQLDEDPTEKTNLAGTDSGFDAMQTRMLRQISRRRHPSPNAERPYDEAAVASISAEAMGPRLSTFKGPFPHVPDVSVLEPDQTLAVDDIERSDASLTAGALHWDLMIEVRQTGPVTFTLSSDVPVIGRLHDILLLDTGREAPVQQIATTLRLQAGRHPLRLTALVGEPNDEVSLKIENAEIVTD